MRERVTSDHIIEAYLLRTENYPAWARTHVAARLALLRPEHAGALAEYVALEEEMGDRDATGEGGEGVTVIGYELEVTRLLELSRRVTAARAPLTPAQRARNFGEVYGRHNGCTPSRGLVGVLHPQYSEEEITEYVAGAAQALRSGSCSPNG